MRIEILSDQPVSPNLSAGETEVTCAYPLSALLADGTVVTVYRKGAEKHSHDGILVMQTSPDHGETWSDPSVVFDGRSLDPPQTVVSGGICQVGDGALLASFGTVEGLPPGVYMFSEEGEKLPRRLCVSRSEDRGKNWSPPEYLDFPGVERAGVTTKPFVLPDGQVCLPVEFKRPGGPSGTAMVFSSDSGRTFGELVVVAEDPAGRLNLCDARFDRLPDGRIITLLWTFLQGSEETIEVHRSYSSDEGRTWSAPEPVGFVGQITAPLALPAGELIAASNYRHPPEGIRLWYSPDGGATWDTGYPVQMWDLEQSRVLGEPVREAGKRHGTESVWDALALFSFGTPDLLRFPDGSLLLTYYGTIGGIVHVRACRFRVSF